MKSNFSYIFSFLYGVIFLISFFIKDYTLITLVFTALIFIHFLVKLGSGIVFRELLAFHGVVLCLLMPVVGYTWYSQTNSLSRVFYFFMVVPEETYFSFVFPALSGFVFFVLLPIQKRGYSDEGFHLNRNIEAIKDYVKKNPNIGLKLVAFGLLSTVVSPFVPESLKFFFTLIYFVSYAGILMIYYNREYKYRKIILILFSLTVAIKALGGMFTEVAYMGITILSFIFYGNKTSFFRKISISVIGIAFLILLQSVKGQFRLLVWGEGYQGNKAALFSKLMYESAMDFDKLFDVDKFLFIYSRFNQGLNISRSMSWIPRNQDYDHGQRLFGTMVSSLVPRVIWPDKPMAGGRENMKYYTGWTIKGWSTNVGPIGEAYGSFGDGWGIFFMVCLGVFVRWVYLKIFQLSLKRILLILWLPVLFYQVASFMETDTLTLLNALLKGALFLFILDKIAPEWFGRVTYRNNIKRDLRMPDASDVLALK